MTTSPTAVAAVAPATSRLPRLLAFLDTDPDNLLLRADAFETALEAGAFDIARAQLDAARAATPAAPSPEWRMREANLEIAQSRFEHAEALLLSMQDAFGHHPAISQNLGFIALHRGQAATCLDLLAEWAEVPPASPVLPSLQALWLRALHHLGQLERALDWARRRQASGDLHAEAQGVASLLALDANETVLAKSWAEQALAAQPMLHEAMLTHATLLLGERNSAAAKDVALDILAHHPHSGRAWSALGLAQMLDMNLPSARPSLEQAVRWMPGHVGTWHGLAWACFLTKDYAGAQHAFEEALARNHNFSETHGGLAAIAAATGQRAAAEEHLRRAFGLDERCMTAQYARAILDGALGDEKAIHALARKIMRQAGPVQ